MTQPDEAREILPYATSWDQGVDWSPHFVPVGVPDQREPLTEVNPKPHFGPEVVVEEKEAATGEDGPKGSSVPESVTSPESPTPEKPESF